MERSIFKDLLVKFSEEKDINLKTDILLKYELSTLTMPQIQKIIDTLDVANVRKFIDVISKRVGEWYDRKLRC